MLASGIGGVEVSCGNCHPNRNVVGCRMERRGRPSGMGVSDAGVCFVRGFVRGYGSGKAQLMFALSPFCNNGARLRRACTIVCRLTRGRGIPVVSRYGSRSVVCHGSLFSSSCRVGRMNTRICSGELTRRVGNVCGGWDCRVDGVASDGHRDTNY